MRWLNQTPNRDNILLNNTVVVDEDLRRAQRSSEHVDSKYINCVCNYNGSSKSTRALTGYVGNWATIFSTKIHSKQTNRALKCKKLMR